MDQATRLKMRVENPFELTRRNRNWKEKSIIVFAVGKRFYKKLIFIYY
jgi:hypothetical protein